MRGVYMQPDPALLAQRPYSFQIVERSGCGSARGRHDCHHALALVTQPVQSSEQEIDIDLVITRRYGDSCATSHSELADRARHSIVRMLTVHDHRWVGA